MWIGRIICAVASTLAAPGTAWAHGGADAHSIMFAWTADPWTLIPIAAASLWYALGICRQLAERSETSIRPSRLLAFAAGILVLVIALHSPIDTLGEDLFSAHMVQHLLLMLAAPPLLIWSDPAIAFLRALPRAWRKAAGAAWRRSRLAGIFEFLMSPVLVWIAFCGGFVFWHSPGPYAWALANNAVHVLEHLTFFITSLAFWSIVIPVHGRRRLEHGATLIFVVTTAVLSGLPGALMIFAPRPLYPVHAHGVAEWGLTLLQDQQLAGLIMWIPAGAAYVLAAGWLFVDWLREAERRALASARRAAGTMGVLALAALVLSACGEAESGALVNFDGNASRGRALVPKYGCGGCHLIPTIPNARGNVGPPLDRIGSRTYIAGMLHNSPENMAIWLRHPQRIVPGNAMPDLDMSRDDSRDLTAFLYTLK